MENVIVSEEKKKPAYDEQTLAKLLEAAYVLQEHGEELRALEAQLGLTRSTLNDSEEGAPAKTASPNWNTDLDALAQNPPTEAGKASASSRGLDPHHTLDRLAELQHQIEVRHLGLDEALALIAKRLLEICGAAGAAIGISSGNQISYRGVAGVGTPPLNASVALEKACCFPCLRTGQVFCCPDVNTELLIDAEECTRRGMASFIATPVFGENRIAGGMELYFSHPNAFNEQDVQTCQLTAGIITELLPRESKALDSMSEMSALLQHLSKLEPAKPPQPISSVSCYNCGHELIGEEHFCGECGAARIHQGEPASMQSKAASLRQMQQATPGTTAESVSSSGEALGASSMPTQVPVSLRALPDPALNPPESAPESQDQTPSPVSGTSKSQEGPAELSFNGEPGPSGDWSSAVSAKEYLELLAENTPRGWLATFWNEHRGDVYLAIAIFLVVAVVRWGLGSPRTISVGETGSAATHKAAAPELSLFDRFLIQVGLADPPPVPEDKGNPSAAVWVDLQTGLYYCPGADLYGKTPKGKYTAQRDAQLDQFAPAYRKVCD